MRINLSLLVLLLIALQISVSADEVLSPWGYCAHFNRDTSEFEYQTDKQIRLLREAGVKSVRMDFNFSKIAKKKGVYDFSHYDRVYDSLNANDMSILPILSGYYWEVEKVRPDALPMHEHPDEWQNFIRAVAEHYKGKITVWSFWNEPDGGFWRPNPNPEQYMDLLRITWTELKSADPNNQVMLGGLVRSDFLRDIYKLNGQPYFDLISIHPYGWGGDRNKRFDKVLDTFRAILDENGDTDKPIWFTECGASSAENEFIVEQPQAMRQTLQLAADKIGRQLDFDNGFSIGVPVLADADLSGFNTSRTWLANITFVPLVPDKVTQLMPTEIPAIVCEGETLAEEFVTPLLDYVKRGGIVIFNAQVPLFNLNYVNALGSRANRSASSELYPLFRMNWHAHWNRKGTPYETTQIIPAEDMDKSGFIASLGHANRYFNNDNLPTEVEYTPILQAIHGDKVVGDALALHTYSDWKGAIIACSLIKFNDFVTPDQQADLIQTFAVYTLSREIPRFYFYVFRNTGLRRGEREDNFGMVTRDLQPKPTYHAYKTMTEKLGSKPKFIRQLPSPDNFFMMLFQRQEDEQHILAFWSVDATIPYSVTGVGQFQDGAVHFVEVADDADSFTINYEK